MVADLRRGSGAAGTTSGTTVCVTFTGRRRALVGTAVTFTGKCRLLALPRIISLRVALAPQLFPAHQRAARHRSHVASPTSFLKMRADHRDELLFGAAGRLLYPGRKELAFDPVLNRLRCAAEDFCRFAFREHRPITKLAERVGGVVVRRHFCVTPDLQDPRRTARSSTSACTYTYWRRLWIRRGFGLK